MSVNGVESANSYFYKSVNKSNNRIKGTAMFDQSGMTIASNPWKCQNSGFSANDAYNCMRMNGKFKSEIGEKYLQSFDYRSVSLLGQSKGDVQKVDNERYLINVSDGIAGYWRIYDKESNHSFTFDPRDTSIQTDENTGRDYIISCDPRGQLMNVMYADSALIEGIKTFLHTDQITKSALNDKYSVEVHADTGIECLKVKGQEGKGSWLMMDSQQLNKLQDLADLYKEKYPNLINEDGLAKGLAIAEAAGQVKRTENGIMIIACNGMQYMDNNDQSKGWGFIFSENNTDIYNQIIKAILEDTINGGIESVSGWEKWFQGKGYLYERIFSDEELTVMADGKKIKSAADVDVRLKGEKILAVTMNVETMTLDMYNPAFIPEVIEE